MFKNFNYNKYKGGYKFEEVNSWLDILIQRSQMWCSGVCAADRIKVEVDE